MRKSSTILEELNENKELAKATGLAADEKDFIEGEIADLEKEYEAALAAEKNTPAPKKKVAEPVIVATVGTKKTGKATPVETPAAEKPKKAKKSPKTQDEMAFIVYKGKKIYENEPEYCEKSIEAWKERKAAQKKAAGKYKTKPVIQKVASNIVSAVAKGIDTIKHNDIKDNPKEAIKKMENLEKAGKQFLEAWRNILGEKISDKAIKEEFEGLDETIKKISEKYLAEKTKFENGGEIYERGKNYPVKRISASDCEKYGLDDFPNFDKSGSISGMKKQYYGKDALLVKCGNYIYNVTSKPEIYFNNAFFESGGEVEDVSGNYYSSTDFVESHNLMPLAKQIFGQDWESGGDFDYDTEEIKLLIKELGGNYKVVYVDSELRDKFESAKQKYFPDMKYHSNDGDIFVVRKTPKFKKGGIVEYQIISDDLDEIFDDEESAREFWDELTEEQKNSAQFFSKEWIKKRSGELEEGEVVILS